MKRGFGSSRSKSSAPARAISFEEEPQFEKPERPVPKAVAATSQPQPASASSWEEPSPADGAAVAARGATPKMKVKAEAKTEAETTAQPEPTRAEIHQMKLLKMHEAAQQFKVDEFALVPVSQVFDPAELLELAAGAGSSSCGEKPADEADYGDAPADNAEEPYLPSDSEDESEQVERAVASIERLAASLKRKIGDQPRSAGWFGKAQKIEARVEALLKARRLLQIGPEQDMADAGVWSAPRTPSPDVRREASNFHPLAVKFMEEMGFENFDVVKDERTLVVRCCEWSRTRIS